MRAIVQDGYGSADIFRLADLPRPEPKPDQVLVHVHAAGLDRGTWHLMHGKPYVIRPFAGFRGPRQPVPGLDLAGTIAEVGAEVGAEVEDWSVGDEVYGVGVGSFAEYAVAKPGKLARRPTTLTFTEAAVVPVSGVTALTAVAKVGRIEAGQRVLVLGASGGVGSFAVQIAKALGAAEVTGVCSAGKRDLVQALGADRVLDYAQDDFAAEQGRYDLVVDIAGGPSLKRLRRALTARGTAVMVGSEEGGDLVGLGHQLKAVALSPFMRQRMTMFVSSEKREDLERLTELIEAGQVTPALDRAFPLEQAAEAMRHLESGQARGKIAISVLPD